MYVYLVGCDDLSGGNAMQVLDSKLQEYAKQQQQQQVVAATATGDYQFNFNRNPTILKLGY